MRVPGLISRVRTAPTPLLLWAFVAIIAGFLLTSIISIYEMRKTQAKAQLIVERALASIELVSRLAHDIDQGRLLFEAHIVEIDKAGITEIEEQLDEVDAQIAATSRAYEPTIDDEIERAVWQELQARIAAVRPQTARVLDLSRQNLSANARTAMKTIGPEFKAIDQAMDALVRLNHEHADQEVVRIRSLNRTTVIILLTLTIVWMAFALLVATWVTRLIKQRESQTREATARLEERNRELDAFAGRVAHDLRGPLTSINLAASTKLASFEEATGAIFRRGVMQMETIIRDLLTLSRTGQTTGLTCQTAGVVASVEEDLRPKVEEVGGRLHIEAPAATVSCSEGLLRQVLWNLGENAVKYRRVEVQLEVDVRGRITAADYEFRVTDNGMGMSPAEVRQAFEPFFRGEKVRSTPGTGLGLSIVKRVVEASGGSLSVESIAGRGTTFRIRLPLASSKAA